MTSMLTTIHFESAYLLCHVNVINAHLTRIETGLRASCERAFSLLCQVMCCIMIVLWYTLSLCVSHCSLYKLPSLHMIQVYYLSDD